MSSVRIPHILYFFLELWCLLVSISALIFLQCDLKFALSGFNHVLKSTLIRSYEAAKNQHRFVSPSKALSSFFEIVIPRIVSDGNDVPCEKHLIHISTYIRLVDTRFDGLHCTNEFIPWVFHKSSSCVVVYILSVLGKISVITDSRIYTVPHNMHNFLSL
jgi:hypothetical protein